MPINYAARARIADKCRDAGVRESDIDTFIVEYEDRAYEESELTREWFAAQKKARPHRFIGGVTEEDELARSAASGNLTDQGRLVTRYGIAAATEIMARHGATLGSTKPGTDPNESTDAKQRKNPWLRDDPEAKAERLRIIRTMPTRVAAGLAAAAGKDLAGRPLRKRA